jgi:hypothetical protein
MDPDAKLVIGDTAFRISDLRVSLRRAGAFSELNGRMRGSASHPRFRITARQSQKRPNRPMRSVVLASTLTAGTQVRIENNSHSKLVQAVFWNAANSV